MRNMPSTQGIILLSLPKLCQNKELPRFSFFAGFLKK